MVNATHLTQTLIAALAALLLGLQLISCSGPRANPTTPAQDATARLQAIPAADPAKYASMRSKAWRNPYLIIRSDGVALLDVRNSEERRLKPEEVLDTLARLPANSWPYGRVVAIEETAASSGSDKIAIRRIKGIVAGTLEDVHVAINWMPSP